MTRDEIDIMWQQAMQESIKDGEMFTRYHFAKLVAEKEREVCATKEDFRRELERRLKNIREEMKIKSVTMRCKDYDIALPIIDTDFGRVLVGQVSTSPQRKPLTDEKISDQQCRRLLYGFMLDFNAVGFEQAGRNLHRAMKEAAHGIKE